MIFSLTAGFFFVLQNFPSHELGENSLQRKTRSKFVGNFSQISRNRLFAEDLNQGFFFGIINRSFLQRSYFPRRKSGVSIVNIWVVC